MRWRETPPHHWPAGARNETCVDRLRALSVAPCARRILRYTSRHNRSPAPAGQDAQRAGYFQLDLVLLRRGGRVVEGARLESVYTGNRIAGSNPAPSAI